MVINYVILNILVSYFSLHKRMYWYENVSDFITVQIFVVAVLVLIMYLCHFLNPSFSNKCNF